MAETGSDTAAVEPVASNAPCSESLVSEPAARPGNTKLSVEHRIDTLLREATSALAAIPEGTPRLEAELLLSEATGWSRTRLFAWPDHPVASDAHARFHALLARRLAGEPIAYIRGRQAFWSLELHVTPATLIPRPETELLVETALETLLAEAPLRIADLGTGSGAIAAALATERPVWHLLATDRSPAALEVARENLVRLGLRNATLLRAHWSEAFAPASLDAVVSNPPYVAADDPHLARGDLRYEPREALTPGGDGLDAYRAIATDARRCLRQGGWLILEHGYDQGRDVRRILIDTGLKAPTTRSDLAGHDRVTLAQA
ncbi:peptide chain release factor N(5)-glutamine methyltransferase [Thiocapsa marina]|uniref:Release factor glutamine methyltransferase n=1 Tax=Thiocapsa marina 5811 TaxID=768671 RepID=F9U5U1_9GAMM|nr:peptide chain release factor N(5)-glutamine methyltransferase [Thiocapsa marina]EGV20514.1 protein-(glutamine-N5) methyltransferase, release factor-specific [Thiocapsa marina 5811]